MCMVIFTSHEVRSCSPDQMKRLGRRYTHSGCHPLTAPLMLSYRCVRPRSMHVSLLTEVSDNSTRCQSNARWTWRPRGKLISLFGSTPIDLFKKQLLKKPVGEAQWHSNLRAELSFEQGSNHGAVVRYWFGHCVDLICIQCGIMQYNINLTNLFRGSTVLSIGRLILLRHGSLELILSLVVWD